MSTPTAEERAVIDRIYRDIFGFDSPFKKGAEPWPGDAADVEKITGILRAAVEAEREACIGSLEALKNTTVYVEAIGYCIDAIRARPEGT